METREALLLVMALLSAEEGDTFTIDDDVSSEAMDILENEGFIEVDWQDRIISFTEKAERYMEAHDPDTGVVRWNLPPLSDRD